MFATGMTLQDRYTIVRLLGIGGMAAVYEATDRRLRINVALKHLHVGDARRHASFEREAQLLAALRHPTLPTVHDYFVEGDSAFLVMQLVSSADLAAQLAGRNTPFPIGLVLRWADELLDALAYLHQQRPPIIHRDIKPQNLKLRPDGGIMLLDFGLAKGAVGAAHSVAPSIFGYTLQYAPLEQIRGEGTDARSDLFALAMTLYELLTKRRPPDALERIAALGRGGNDPLQPAHLVARHLPSALGESLHAALALDAAQRPISAALLDQSLRDAGISSFSEAEAAFPTPTIIAEVVDAPSSWQATAQPALPLPTGTVTFVLASARLPDAKSGASTSNDRQQFAIRIQAGLERSGGAIFHNDGTTVGAAYGAATDGLAGAILLARRELGFLHHEQAPGGLQIALHCGVAEERDGIYVGPPVERALRMLDVCHSGQILLSRTVHELASDYLAPGVALRELGSYRLRGMVRPEAIFQVVAPGLPADFPPLVPGGRQSTNLPHQPTALIGRVREVAAVSALVRHSTGRLVTLTGPGGIGKTRLAIEVASGLADSYADGVAFVGLAAVDSAALVWAAVGQALGVREPIGGGIRDAVRAFLHEKQFLLLLDNFEHVLAAAPEVHALLDASLRLHIIATSRQRLGVTAEEIVPVPPLGLTDEEQLPTGDERLAILADSGAVALFVERARTVQPNFVLSHANAITVATICRRLDGLPLAIELAAARARLFTPEALLARLEGAYADTPLRLLTGGKANQPARQRTLREAISWSYDLLDDDEQSLFQQLALFAGGCTLEAIESVAQLPATEDRSHLDLLISLLDKSLLREEQQPDGEPRFILLETIRAYAREQLVRSGEAKDGQARHAAYYLALAETAEPHLRSHDQLHWLARLDREYANMRSALGYYQHGNVTNAQRLLGALWWFSLLRGHFFEWRQQVEMVLTLDSTVAEQATLLVRVGLITYILGDFVRSKHFGTLGLALTQALNDPMLAACFQLLIVESEHEREASRVRIRSLGDPWLTALVHLTHQEGLELARATQDNWLIAHALFEKGRFAMFHGELTAARMYHEEQLQIRQKLGDRHGLAYTLLGLAEVVEKQGDYTAARRFQQERLHVERELGNMTAVADAMLKLGEFALLCDEQAQAQTYFTEGLTLARAAGDVSELALLLYDIGTSMFRRSNYPKAIVYLEESLQLFQSLNDHERTPWAMWWLGKVALAQGHYDQAQALLEPCVPIYEQQGGRARASETIGLLGAVALARGDFTAATPLLEEALILARERQDKWDIATQLEYLGNLAYRTEQAPHAEAFLAESLDIRRTLNDHILIANTLCSLGMLALTTGAVSRAESLFRGSLIDIQKTPEKSSIATILEGLAGVASTYAQPIRAARLWGAAEALREALGAPMWQSDRAAYERAVIQTGAQCDHTAFTAAWDVGRHMPLGQAITYALKEP